MLLNVDWEERVNWERLRKYRIDRIVEQLKKKGLRAVMLSKLDTIRYATSFRGVYTWQFHGNRYIALITDEGHVSFFVGSGEYSKVRETMPWLTDVTPFPFVMEEGYDLVEAKLRELGITKGKVGVDMMKFAMIDKIQRGMPDLELVDGYSVVENAQLVKNPDEIVLLKANAQLADIGTGSQRQDQQYRYRNIDHQPLDLRLNTLRRCNDIDTALIVIASLKIYLLQQRLCIVINIISGTRFLFAFSI